MATSGSKTVRVTAYDNLVFSWSVNSQSVANNTSTVSWTLKLVAGAYGKISSEAAKDYTVTVNGTKYSGTNTIGVNNNATKTLASGTTTIKHNSDGSKTFSYSFSQEIAITYSGSYIGTKTGSGTGALNTIPRASTVSATSAYIASGSVITISRKSSSFKHTLQYKVAGQSSYTNIVSKTGETNYTWIIPASVYELIPNAKSVKITINCITYNGDTNIGSNTCTITATCRESLCKPQFIPDIKDTNSKTKALTGDEGVLVRYYSNAYVYSNAYGQNEAEIKSQKITNGSKSYTSSPCTFTGVTEDIYIFSATDTRGFTSSISYAPPFIEYIKLTCSLKATASLESDNTTTLNFTVSGNYFNDSFGAVDNDLLVQYRYKEDGGTFSSWTGMLVDVSKNKYTATNTITGLDYQKSYTIEARAQDALWRSYSNYKSGGSKTVKATPIFDWGKDDFRFNVDVNFPKGDYAITGTNSNGDVVDALQPCNVNNNMVLGFGNYENDVGHTNIYGADINIFTKTDVALKEYTEDKYYSLLGMARAMSNSYEFTASAKAGANYSSVEAEALLTGNILRCYINVTRSSAPSVGNITNEEVCTLTITHNGKIKGAAHNSFGTGGTGGQSAFYTSSMSVGDTTMSFKVNLGATTVASQSYSAYFILPVTLNLTKFVEE